MLRNGSTYWLFYSGNDWNGDTTPKASPGARAQPGRAPQTAGTRSSRRAPASSGPGRGEVFIDTASNWWLAYHAYQEPLVGYPNSRLLYLSPISLDAGGRRRSARDASEHPLAPSARGVRGLGPVQPGGEPNPALIPSHRNGSGSQGGDRWPTQGAA